MISKIIYSINSPCSLGCTFLDWSLQWLSGNCNMWHVRQKTWVSVISDPLNGNNAHGHAKNHPCGIEETIDTIEQLQKFGGDFSGFYPYAHEFDWHATQLGLDIKNLEQSGWAQINQLRQQELVDITAACQDHEVATIYINVSPRWQLYFLQPRKFPPWLEHHSSWASALGDLHGIDPSLKIWDWREQLSLDIRPFDSICNTVCIDRSRDHLWLEAEDIWFDGERTIPDLFKNLGYQIDHNRQRHWREIWLKWQATQIRHLRFTWQLPNIIDAVIHGYHFQLPEMGIIEEAVIQHCLIYAHDVNFRNWNLDHFPLNALDLHALLEPNTHNITDATYQDLLRRSIDSLRSSI